MKLDIEDLKLCPFCGGKAVVEIEHWGMYSDWIIRCDCCGACIARPADTFYEREPCTREEVIEAWNRRVDNGQLSAQQEQKTCDGCKWNDTDEEWPNSCKECSRLLDDHYDR